MQAVKRVCKAVGWGIPLLILLALVFYFVLPGYAFSALIFLGLAVLLGCFRLLRLLKKRRPRLANGLRLVLLAILCAVLTAALVTGVFIVRAGFGDAEADCEYVIVLGAGVNGTVPSLSLRERLDAAYAYLTAHPEAVCIVSGGQGPGEDISEAACMYADLTSRGIDEARVWQEDAAANTKENIANSLALIEEKTGARPERAGIVSSEYHLYRAGLFAKAQNLAAVGIPAKTGWVSLRINYFLREIAAVWYYSIFGG